jgi:hypothetical protein
MKHVAPILSRNSARKRSAFASHSAHRKSVRIGILDCCQTASVLSFRMHQPEGFKGNCAAFRRGRKLRGSRLFYSLSRPWQRRLESSHPVPHRAPTESIVIAIFASSDTTSKPCLDVDGPVSAARAALVIALHFGLVSHRKSPATVNSGGGIRWKFRGCARVRRPDGYAGVATVRLKRACKIKGRDTVAASSRCLHKVFSGTPFFSSGTHFLQLIERTQFIACHLLPGATTYDRSFAPPASSDAPRNCKWLAIVCHDHA